MNEETLPRWERLLSASEAASRLGVSRQRVYQLIDAGLLAKQVVHGRTMVTERSVELRINALNAEGVLIDVNR